MQGASKTFSHLILVLKTAKTCDCLNSTYEEIEVLRSSRNLLWLQLRNTGSELRSLWSQRLHSPDPQPRGILQAPPRPELLWNWPAGWNQGGNARGSLLSLSLPNSLEVYSHQSTAFPSIRAAGQEPRSPGETQVCRASPWRWWRGPPASGRPRSASVHDHSPCLPPTGVFKQPLSV